MAIVEIPSKTYKLNEDVLVKKTKLKEPITIIEESPININDSLNGYPLTITSLYGNTSQEITTGKNLLPNIATTQTINGITFTKREDGTVNVNGTATANAILNLVDSDVTLQSGTYTLSGCAASGSGSTYKLDCGGTGFSFTDIGSANTQTLSEEKILTYARIVVYSGTTIRNKVFQPMLEKNSSATSYEKYTYGASPNPNYQQPIKVVTGDVTVNVCNKNLANITILDKVPALSNGNLTNFVGAGCTDFIEIDNQKEYVYSHASNTTQVYIMFYDATKEYLGYKINIQSGYNLSNYANYSSAKYIRYRTDSRPSVQGYMIEQGSTATSYEPYTAQSQLLSLGNIELCNIGDYQDKLFKAVDGNKVYDSLTAEQKATLTYRNWYIYKFYAKQVLNGTEEGITIYSSNTSRTVFKVPASNVSGYLSMHSENILSSHFKAVNQSVSWTNGMVSTRSGDSYLYYTLAANETVDSFKTWLASNNVTTYYLLNNSVFEEITDTTLLEQLDALHEFVTYKNITNIFTVTDNEEPELEINYYNSSCVDIVSEIVDSIDGYIDNKEAMKQAIYHLLRTERYSYIIYTDNYGVELKQYIGRSFDYLKNNIQQTLRDALLYDLRITDVNVLNVEQVGDDSATVDFIASTIYGDLQLEVNVIV